MKSLSLIKVKVNAGEFRTSHGFFVPLSPTVRLHGSHHSAYDDEGELYAALLVVPLSGRDADRFIRRAETLIGRMLGQLEPSFLSQEGWWRWYEANGLNERDAMRLIMPHLTERGGDDFRVDAAEIAYTLGIEFQIKEMWLEFQRAGISGPVFRVTP